MTEPSLLQSGEGFWELSVPFGVPCTVYTTELMALSQDEDTPLPSSALDVKAALY